jgi:molybdopterin-synthase adenylyltransferase
MSGDQMWIDDDDRYARLRLIPWWDQQRLMNACILVVGAGALGNEVLKNLALVGVGRIYVVDFDRIEIANLTRSVLFRARDQGRRKAEVAAEAIRDLNPDVKIIACHGNVMTDVGLGVFRDADVVIGCLDNREARLWVNRCCWKTGTPWVDGGIQEINGVVKVFTPPSSACYECAMTENDYRLINLRYSCPMFRNEDIAAGRVPTAPTIASMIGGWQTQESLKLLHGIPVEGGQALVYNGIANRFYRTQFQRREDCLSHETYPDPLELPLRAAETTARQLFAAIDDAVGEASMRLCLDRDLVVRLCCEPCGTSELVMRPLAALDNQLAICPQCGQPRRPERTHQITSDSELVDQTLAQLGIPPYDLIRVVSGDHLHVIALAGDQPSIWSTPTE